MSHVDIKLTKALSIAGADVKALRMREPTVGDQLTAEAHKGSDADREIAMFANLCEVAPDDIKRLTLKDYRALQKAFAGFLD